MRTSVSALAAAVAATVTLVFLSACSTSFAPTDPATEGDLPVLSSTDGTGIRPAESESEHLFGDTATVLSTDGTGRILAWDATVSGPFSVDASEVVLEDRDDLENAEGFRCHTVSLAFLGATVSEEDDGVLRVIPADDPAATEDTPYPSFSAASSEGTDAGQIVPGGDGATSAEANCGIPESDRLPLVQGDLVVGSRYRTAVLSVLVADAEPTETPDVVRFDYPTTVPGASSAPGAPTSVYWGAGDE